MAQVARTSFRERIEQREDALSPLATHSYPALREREEPDSDHRTPFQRDRDRIVHSEGLPPAQAQDAGLHRSRGRPLPHAPDPHVRGVRHRPQRGSRPGPQRGPDRGHRARSRPRPSPLRAHRGGGARRLRRARAGGTPFATTSTRCGWWTGSSGSTSPSRCATASFATPVPSRRRRSRAGSSGGRPDRLHQSRHRRRAARRSADLRRPPAGERSRCWLHRSGAHRDAGSGPAGALGAGRRHRAGGKRRRCDASPTRVHVPAGLPGRRRPAREVSRGEHAARAVRPLRGRAAAAPDRGRVRRAARGGLACRDDRPLRDPHLLRALPAQRF